MATIGMYNQDGENVDLYIPRRCNATNSLITSNDYSSVQIAIANVDANGVIDGTTTTFCISGFIRTQGNSDHAINHLCVANGIVRIKSAKPKKQRKSMKKKGAKGAKGAAAKPAAKGAARPAGAKGAKPAAKASKSAKPTASKAAKPAAKGAKPAAKGAKPAAKSAKPAAKKAPAKKN